VPSKSEVFFLKISNVSLPIYGFETCVLFRNIHKEKLDMKLYENVFIARQDLSTAQVEVLAAAFNKIISENQGQVAKTEYCGLKPLLYPIKKNNKGHYVLMNLKAPAVAINEMERNMRLNEDVIRYLTVKVEEHKEGPSALSHQARAPRDSYRGGRGNYGSDDRLDRDYFLEDEDVSLVPNIEDGE
jgi:small subunit ribosomal protein S6